MGAAVAMDVAVYDAVPVLVLERHEAEPLTTSDSTVARSKVGIGLD